MIPEGAQAGVAGGGAGAAAAGGAAGGGAAAPSGVATCLYLNMGLSNGVLQRVQVDAATGALSDTRTRFLGAKPVRLFRVQVQVSPGQEDERLTHSPWVVQVQVKRTKDSPTCGSCPPGASFSQDKPLL